MSNNDFISKLRINGFVFSRDHINTEFYRFHQTNAYNNSKLIPREHNTIEESLLLRVFFEKLMFNLAIDCNAIRKIRVHFLPQKVVANSYLTLD